MQGKKKEMIWRRHVGILRYGKILFLFLSGEYVTDPLELGPK